MKEFADPTLSEEMERIKEHADAQRADSDAALNRLAKIESELERALASLRTHRSTADKSWNGG